MGLSREEEKNDPLQAQQEARQDLSNLQRQYRYMKNDKKIYTEETENLLRKQKISIEALLQEHAELRMILGVANSRRNEVLDQENQQKLFDLLLKELEIKEEEVLERQKIADVEAQVNALEKAIYEKRREISGMSSQQKHVIVQKQIRVLHNRLDNMIKKFNASMTDNRCLREQIDHYEHQKKRFLDLYRRLRNEMSDTKKTMDFLAEEASANFNTRDEAQHRMAALKERTERDLLIKNAEIKEVLRIIDHDRKLRAFMATKAEDRSAFVEKELMSRIMKKATQHVGNLKLEANKYEEIFGKIKQATNIENTDALVSSFIENEDKNFALFNFVNGSNSEIESLQEEIQKIKEDIEASKEEGVKQDIRRKQILKDLEGDLLKVSQETPKIIKKHITERRSLEQLKPRIETMFNKIKCSRASINHLLGTGASVNDENVLQYLGIIEQKCNEYLQLTGLIKLKKFPEEQALQLHSLQGAGPLPPHGNTLYIAPPSTLGEDSEHPSAPGESRPLTVDELHALVAKGIKGGQVKSNAAQVKRKKT